MPANSVGKLGDKIVAEDLQEHEGTAIDSVMLVGELIKKSKGKGDVYRRDIKSAFNNLDRL